MINGGSYYEPHVVRQILNEQGSVVERRDPVLVRETVSQSTSDFLIDAMFETVENGTGAAASVAGYHVGGKTGTAEKQPRSEKNYVVSFAGFAPVEDPQLFVYVVIDTPGYPPGPEQAHSSYASAIFSKIMAEALPYLNIFPTEELPQAEGETEESLPAEEGIHGQGEAEEPAEETEQPQETERPFETDEYIPVEEGESFDSGVPDAVPGSTVEGQRPVPIQTQESEESSEEEQTQEPAESAAAEE